VEKWEQVIRTFGKKGKGSRGRWDLKRRDAA